MFEKEIIVDGHGHLCGRLASVLAKELLNGQRVVVVRCEKILRSGSLFRNKLAWKEKECKRINTNPRRGAKHWLSPSRMFWKVTRGMTPHKSPRGALAMSHLKVFEGVPFPYDHKKKMVMPEALRVLRLKSHRNFCSMGDIASAAGWGKQDLVNTLEEKRKTRSAKFHELKAKKIAARERAQGDKTVAQFSSELKKYGF